MPRHDFECEHCEIVEEITLRVSEFDEPQACPKCGKDMVRLVGSSTFKLKGRGWALDGYQGGKQLAMSGVRKDRVRGYNYGKR